MGVLIGSCWYLQDLESALKKQSLRKMEAVWCRCHLTGGAVSLHDPSPPTKFPGLLLALPHFALFEQVVPAGSAHL
jgi:hypothetical protein